MISRILGFVRDIMIAFVLGTGAVADSFFVAFRFPNLFRRLFGEGAFNAAFVPIFARSLEGDGKEGARRFAEEVLAALLFILLLLTAVAELLMPWFMYLLAPGFSDTPAKYELAVLLSRITFPYLLCMSLVAMLSGILNSMHRFTASAMAPIILNIVLVTAMTLTVWGGLINTPKAGIILAWGVFAAGFMQLLMLFVAVRGAGFGLRLCRPKMTPGVKKLLKLVIPGAIAGGITQINIMIGTIIASMQDGAVSFLYYADRIYQLPLGVIGIAIGVVLLPGISRLLRAGDDIAANTMQNNSLEFSMLLTLPAAVALLIVPDQIIGVLFQRGAFDAADTANTAFALRAFACGLPAFVLIKVFSPGFFAREDTKTPMFYAGFSIVANIGLSLILFPFIGHVGIAIATSLSGWMNAILLAGSLYGRGFYIPDNNTNKRIGWMFIASIVMGVMLYTVVAWLSECFYPAASMGTQTVALGALVISGVVSYLSVAYLTKAINMELLSANSHRR
jgi:putative peptidoglycan lipid II flippase